MESKLQMNSAPASAKFSSLEKQLNKYIIYLFILIFLICILLTLGSLTIWEDSVQHWYLTDIDSGLPARNSMFLNFFTYLVLLNAFIPLSLVVSMELSTFAQRFFMVRPPPCCCSCSCAVCSAETDAEMTAREQIWDDKMKSEEAGPMKNQASALNAELGQIEYVFSDKTGTLTQNKMVFKHCSIQCVVSKMLGFDIQRGAAGRRVYGADVGRAQQDAVRAAIVGRDVPERVRVPAPAGALQRRDPADQRQDGQGRDEQRKPRRGGALPELATRCPVLTWRRVRPGCCCQRLRAGVARRGHGGGQGEGRRADVSAGRGLRVHVGAETDVGADQDAGGRVHSAEQGRGHDDEAAVRGRNARSHHGAQPGAHGCVCEPGVPRAAHGNAQSFQGGVPGL
eukprot:2693688-Rhodomonas_salina.1